MDFLLPLTSSPPHWSISLRAKLPPFPFSYSQNPQTNLELLRAPKMEAFPAGLRILVVDDDPTWLKILEKMLRKCYYEVTTCGLATVALDMLREQTDRFDIVISDVNMPDMDGFKLLEQVGLEMDLPVIMMSVDGETSRVMKGVQHGACDYLLKPIRMKELKNIWQHVFRKKINEMKGIEHPDGLEEFQLVRSKSEHLDGGQILYGSDLNSPKKRKDISNKELADRDIVDSYSVKKARVVWSVDLHQNFVNAVNQIGYDKVGPKKILDLMNVPGLSREHVASHLQKYRLYLSRLQKQNEGTFSPRNSSESLQMSSNNIQDYSGKVVNNKAIVPEKMGTNVYTDSMLSSSGIQGVEHKLQKMHSSSDITQDVQHRQQRSLITNDSNPAIPLRKCIEKRQDFFDSLSEYQHLHQLGMESSGGYISSLLPAITTGWSESFSFPTKTGDHRSGCDTCLPQPRSVLDSIAIKVEPGDVKSTSFSSTPTINGPSHAKNYYPDQYLIDSIEYTSQKTGSTWESNKDVSSIQDSYSVENLSLTNMDIFQYDSLAPVAELQGKMYEDFQLECDYNFDFMDYPTTGSSLFT